MLWQAKKADGDPLSVAKLAGVVERQRRQVTIGLSCLSVAALALSGFTLYQLQQAQSQRFEKLAANQEQTQLLQSTVYSVASSPDGKRIVSGSNDKTIRIWDATTGQPIGKPLTGHEKGVSSVAFSPDGKRIVSGSFDKTIRIWDAATGQMIGKPLTGHENSVNSVAYSPDGKRIISGSGDQKVLIWDVPKIGLSQPAQPNPAHSNNKRSLVLSAPSKSYQTTDVPHSFSTRPRLRPVQKIHSKSHHKLAKSPLVPVKALPLANNVKPRPSYMRSNRLYEPPSK